jgi:hypothetical protein
MSSPEGIAAIQVRIAKAQSKEPSMRPCEIIFVAARAKGYVADLKPPVQR